MVMTREGIITKGYSGFYYVWDGNSLWECSLRGKFRVKKQTFLPGDRVIMTILDEDRKKAVIEQVLPRKTELVRPTVANVDQAVIVTALANPEPDFWLLDRLLVMVQYNLVVPILCFNKCDMVSPDEAQRVKEVYEKAGFPSILASAKKGWGLDQLKEVLQDKISVFAGPSGVGKSSLLNALEAGLSLKTGAISEKMRRGKHTTRHVELIHLSSGGFIADTPGFSSIYLPKELKREELIKYYPDFFEYQQLCRFTTCLHRDEPQCAVKEAVALGNLDKMRYERYIGILEEVIEQERRY
jgi:ribosome biogenesis GTPase